MALFNLRLGYWVPNPAIHRYWRARLNHFQSLWYELLPFGYRRSQRYLQLSDGGHFENTGIYELLRRGTELIIACDVGADPDFEFNDLNIAFQRAEQDFGVRVNFDDDNQWDRLISRIGDPEYFRSFPNGVAPAAQGHIVADIKYADGRRGTLVILKSTFVDDLSIGIQRYKQDNPTFPDQSTADQFFAEDQFEAYRELGYVLAKRMMDDVKDEGWVSRVIGG